MKVPALALKRRNATHCVNGHPFSPENTYIRKTGGRQCKTCISDRRNTDRIYRRLHGIQQDKGIRSGLDVLDRLTDRTIFDETVTGCWEWQGLVTDRGYGNLRVNNQPQYVHRIAYEVLIGPIPEGLTIDHLCCNRACWNPEHLEAVTQGTNISRGRRKGEAQAALKRYLATGYHRWEAPIGKEWFF